MITVIRSDHGLTVDGHAGFAETGNDIICAAVSALAQGLIHALSDLTEDEIFYNVRDGHIEIFFRDLSEQGKLLTDSFFLSVGDIQQTYGENFLTVYPAPDGRKTEC